MGVIDSCDITWRFLIIQLTNRKQQFTATLLELLFPCVVFCVFACAHTVPLISQHPCDDVETARTMAWRLVGFDDRHGEERRTVGKKEAAWRYVKFMLLLNGGIKYELMDAYGGIK